MSPSRNKICMTLRIRAGDQFACAFAARVKKCWWEMRAYCELATKIDDLMVALIQVPVPATATTAMTGAHVTSFILTGLSRFTGDAY